MGHCSVGGQDRVVGTFAFSSSLGGWEDGGYSGIRERKKRGKEKRLKAVKE